jgi:uncharacterized membrane protein
MTARTEAFSDAILAIAMTLLVLEIKLPPGDADLLPSLANQWPSLLAFAVSFLYIGIYWMNHHAAFTHLARVNGLLLLLNLLFLMTISFVAYPTALLAERLASGHELNVAVAFYGLAMLLPAVTLNLTIWYASYAPGLLADGVNRTRLRADQRAYLLGPIMYAASIPLALALPIVSLGFYVVAPVFYGIVAARDRGWSQVGRG